MQLPPVAKQGAKAAASAVLAASKSSKALTGSALQMGASIAGTSPVQTPDPLEAIENGLGKLAGKSHSSPSR